MFPEFVASVSVPIRTAGPLRRLDETKDTTS